MCTHAHQRGTSQQHAYLLLTSNFKPMLGRAALLCAVCGGAGEGAGREAVEAAHADSVACPPSQQLQHRVF